MSVNIYDGTNDELNQIAGREDTSFWEGTQAQWNALSSADKALWTGKYVIITDDEESVNKYNGTELINIAGKGQKIEDTKDCMTTFTSSDDSTESGLILPSGGDITVPQIVSGDTHGNLFSGLSKAVLNARKLINTVKRIWQTVANAWASGVNYAVGQVVTYTNGHTYICKLAHTSSASITPGNATYWEDKTIGDMICSLNTNYAKLTNYSTAEVAVGKWIDGKTLYRKVVQVNNPAYDWNTTINLGIGYVGYLHLVAVMGYRQAGSSGYWTHINWYHTSSDYGSVILAGNSSNLQVEARIYQTASISKAIFIVEYTKP